MKENVSFSVHHNITGVRRQWEELDRKAEETGAPYVCYSFYQTYRWNEFLYNHINSTPLKCLTCRFDYVVMMSGGHPFAILPMVITRSSGKVRFPSCWVAGILNAASPYSMAGNEDKFDMLRQYINENYHDCRLSLADVPCQAPFAAVMKSLGGQLAERKSFHVCISRFGSFDDYVGSLSKNIYKNIRKAYNHLKTDGKTMRLSVYNKDNMPSDSFMRHLWNIYFVRKLMWRGKPVSMYNRGVASLKAWLEVRGGCATDSLRSLSEARLHVLEIDSRPAAFMVVYADRRHLLMPRLAIDMTYSRYSPGIIMILESVKAWMDEGFVDFDMCRGDERYKIDMGGVNEPLCGIKRT